MKIYTEVCCLCKIEIGKGTGNSKNAFCSEIGYSLGGWGFRKDFVKKMNMEVCGKCFEQLKEKSIALNDTINKLTK